MLELAIADKPLLRWMNASYSETRSSYTAQTLKAWREEIVGPEAPLAFAIGRTAA